MEFSYRNPRFSALVMSSYKWEERDIGLSRRAFVQILSVSSVAVLTTNCSVLSTNVGLHPVAKKETSFITPNEEFFLVAMDPTFRPALGPETVSSQWSLELVGLGGVSSRIGYDELSIWAKQSVFYTLECIGNPVGGQLMGNASWDIIPLREILARASGGLRGARSVHFEGLDGFYSSVSLARAVDDYAFLAMRMNGVPLPAAHGFPARVLLPDLYGKKQPRWLKSISVSEDLKTNSYWEKRGWAGEVPVKTTSRSDLLDKVLAGQPAAIAGVAYAGRRGISKVEVAIDDEDRWFPCTLVSHEAPNVWSLWRYEWKNPSAGRHALFVRATDGTGKLQTQRRQAIFPDGASGYHKLAIDVET